MIYWGVDPPDRRVSQWPHGDTNRIKSTFKFPNAPPFDSLAGRCFLRWSGKLSVPPSSPPDIEEAGWLQLDSSSIGLIEATTIAHPTTGSTFTVRIKDYDVLPILGQQGTEVYLRIDSGGEWAFRTWEYPTVGGVITYKWNLIPPIDSTVGVGQDVTSAGWPYVLWAVEATATADCYDFPRLTPPPIFAAFDGSTSWIDFPADFPYQTGAFKLEFDVRLTAFEQVTIGGLKRFSSNFWGFNNPSSISWWNVTIPLSAALSLNEWHAVRIERDWTNPGPTRYSVFVDGVERANQLSAATISPYDELGRRGTQFHGTFDLRNLKQWSGTPAAPVLTVDLPLTDNACDLASPSQKGTTFNMALPSCP